MRYMHDDFTPQKATILIDRLLKKVTHEDATFNLEIWDTAGQERFKNIITNYFSLSKAAIIVFDVSNEDSVK